MKTFKEYSKSLAFLAILILICVSGLQAQKKWKDYLISGSAMFVSGMLDGTVESINYHYETGFKPRFPNANDQFWNPAVSWKNKYKNGDPLYGPKFVGSTTLFAFTTDAYHLLRTSKRSIDGLTLVYFANKEYDEYKSNASKVIKSKPNFHKSNSKKWKNAAKDFLILTAIRCAGFHLTYTFIFRPQQGR